MVKDIKKMDAWIHETVYVITVMVKGYAMVMKLTVLDGNYLMH